MNDYDRYDDPDVLSAEWERINTLGRALPGEVFCSGCMTNVDAELMRHVGDPAGEHCQYCHEYDC